MAEPSTTTAPSRLAAHHGHVAGVVARRLLLLVGMLVLLVHDDQAQRLDRREDGRAGADDDAGAALADLVPFVVALAGGQMAVQHGHQGLERCREQKRALKRSTVCGVREISGTSTMAPLALRQRVGDGLQVDLGLAAAGDAVEQEGGAGCGAPQPRD